MIEFKQITPEDKQWIDPFLKKSGYQSCEYTFVNLYGWAETYGEEVAVVEDFLVVHINAFGCYWWGTGTGDRRKLLRVLAQDAQERGVPLRLFGLTEAQCAELETLCPDSFTFENHRDVADYCYTIDKLCTLSGKKLHGKRNHIHRFEENYPTWRVEPITVDKLGECWTVVEAWEQAERESGAEDENVLAGEAALYRALNSYDKLGLDGLILYGEQDGVERPLAFTIGQLISTDTYDVCFEKAYAEVQGAYPMMNRSFARWVKEHYPQVVYLNREDDMGEENLRKAKLSYRPDKMIEKFSAEQKKGATL